MRRSRARYVQLELTRGNEALLLFCKLSQVARKRRYYGAQGYTVEVRNG